MTDHAEPDCRNREQGPDRDDDHLADVEPGAGCTEIWEHLSEQRSASADAEEE